MYHLKRYLRWVPALILMAAIAFFSHQTDPVAALAPFVKLTRLSRSLLRVPDYAAHFFEYFCLTLTIGYALHLYKRNNPVTAMIITILFVGVFAISDELHQAFIPRRTPDIRDFGVDILGSVCASILLGFAWLINRLTVFVIRGSRNPI